MGLWVFLILALGFLATGLAGARGVLPREVGLLSLGGFFLCLLCALLLGYKARQAGLDGRTANTSHAMLVMMAGMLKDEDTATLQRIVASGGPAGDAARMLLQKRETPPTG